MNGDGGGQFVDTNILVYAFDSGAGEKHEAAKALIQSLWKSHMGCLSIQVLQEFYVVITRKVALPYSQIEASGIINDLGVWRIHSPTVTDVVAAIDLQIRYQFSFWDAMMVHSALVLGCDVIWTEDLSDGQKIQQATVHNPFLV